MNIAIRSFFTLFILKTTEYKSLLWFDNNQFLEDFLDNIAYGSGLGNRIVGAPRLKFWIPLKFWIYRDDKGNGRKKDKKLSFNKQKFYKTIYEAVSKLILRQPHFSFYTTYTSVIIQFH